MTELLTIFRRKFSFLNTKQWIKEIYTEDSVSEDEAILFGELVEDVVLCIHDNLKHKKFTVVLNKRESSFDINNYILYINISKEIDTIVMELLHELGHIVELQNPSVLNKSLNFLSIKTNKTVEEIDQLLVNKDNVWLEGQFIEPYVGKIYKNKSTEVISMGFQYLYNSINNQMFENKDIQHYKLVYDLLKDGKINE